MTKEYKIWIMKMFIDAFKHQCHSIEELKGLVTMRFPDLSRNAIRKRVARYVSELEKLGLIKKRGDEYCWYIYLNNFEGHEDRDAKVLHSKKLIPALREIAGLNWPRSVFRSPEEYVSEEDLRVLEPYAEKHLKAYPTIWTLLEDYKRVSKREKEETNVFCNNLLEKLRNKFSEPVVDPQKESKHPSFVGSNLPLVICGQLLYGSTTQLKLEGEKMWLGGSLVAKGSHLLNDVEQFIENENKNGFNIKVAAQIKKVKLNAFEIKQELAKEISTLIHKIECNESLLGGCERCPKTYFTKSP